MTGGVREGHRGLGDKGEAVANPACQMEGMRMSGAGELRRAGAAEVGAGKMVPWCRGRVF